MPIQIPVTPRIPPILAPGLGITAALSNGVLTISFDGVTAQVERAVFAAFTSIPKASWSDFVTQYVGDRDSTDGSYQAVFVQPMAPVNGTLWGMLLAYLEGIGQTPLQATTILTSIWAAAPAMPL